MKNILAILILLTLPANAQIVNTLPFQLQNGETADATEVMANYNQIVNNVNSNAAKNGANADITSISGLTTPLGPTFGGSSVYTGGTSTGTANAQVVASPSPSGFTLVAGKRIIFVAGATNTGAMTLNVNSTAAKNVFYPGPNGPQALISGEVKSGNIIEAYYDGTQFQLITNNLSVVGTLTNIAAAATTDLGTVPTHNVNITGAATISAFGSAASVSYPIYYLTFVGVNTLTYNATSMILPGTADITTAAGDSAIVQYLGSGNWKVWHYQRASGANVIATTPLCGATGLVINNNAGTPNTNIDYAADTAVMVNSSGVAVTASTVSGTINTTNVGVVDGIQAARTLSTWYNIYLISNATLTKGFAVAAASVLSAPSGYTYSCRLGSIYSDGSANFMRTKQIGSHSVYVVTSASNTANMPSASSNAVGTYSLTAPVYVSTSLATIVPPTATSVDLVMVSNYKGNTGGSTIIAPNANYGGANDSAGNYPPCVNNAPTNGASYMCTLILETAQTIWLAASGTGSATAVYGWKDKVNAN